MKWLKVGAVVCSAVLITALGIDAADTLSGARSTLLGQVISNGQTTACPSGMVEASFSDTFECIDAYEASPASNCPFADPTSEVESDVNFADAKCLPESKEAHMPWRYVSFMQAQQLCGRVGKRLPTNEQWHAAVTGFADHTACTIDAQAAAVSGDTQCVTPAGVYDMVGNVWEWVDEEVVEGTFNGRQLPASGYVTLADTQGIAIETSQTGAPQYGNDYAHIEPTGIRGMIRGGFYGSGDDAGIFAQNIALPLSLRTQGIGFRCVK